jgi:hypothetical protein
MAAAFVVALVVLVGIVPGVLRLRRRSRQSRLDQPEWSAEWKRAGRSKRRQIARAIRRGEPLSDPHDADLVIGLGRRADLAERSGARRWRWHVLFAAVALVLAVARGQIAVAGAASFALASWLLLTTVVLPRARERRRRAVASAEQLRGTPHDSAGRPTA